MQTLDHHRPVHGAPAGGDGSSGPRPKFVPEHERQDEGVEGQSEERYRSERRRNGPYRICDRLAMSMFCGIAGDRGDAADVRAGGQRQQVRQWLVSSRARQFDQDGREHQADRVVDEQRREDAAGENDRDQQERGVADVITDDLRRRVEESRHAQVRDEHHHAEEQHQGPEVDMPVGIVERGDAGGNHQRRADDGGARAIDFEEGRAAEGQDEVGEEEDGAGDDREEHAVRWYIAQQTACPGSLLVFCQIP